MQLHKQNGVSKQRTVLFVSQEGTRSWDPGGGNRQDAADKEGYPHPSTIFSWNMLSDEWAITERRLAVGIKLQFSGANHTASVHSLCDRCLKLPFHSCSWFNCTSNQAFLKGQKSSSQLMRSFDEFRHTIVALSHPIPLFEYYIYASLHVILIWLTQLLTHVKAKKCICLKLNIWELKVLFLSLNQSSRFGL